MKKLLLPLGVLIAGLAVGGGAAYGTGLLIGPPSSDAPAAAAPADTSFVPTAKILAPLVMPDGRLSGYVAFEVQLEVASDDAEFVTARLPLLLHAVNMRTYRTPMAAGPDGMLPDLATFRKVVMEGAAEAFGKDMVRRAAITQAVPA